MIELQEMAKSDPELKKLLDAKKIKTRPLPLDQLIIEPVSIKNGFYQHKSHLTYGPIDVNYGWWVGSKRIAGPG